ncbi:MAG: protein-disulfide reductase, partial [Deinococcales bacterium]|nr:protein-disulfide reductase [Chitinophagaceae bacterium]
MNKFLLLLLLIVTTLNISTAQEVKPVQFSFATKPVNDSIINLVITAHISQGVKLFSIKKRNSDDVFISALALDSTYKNIIKQSDTATEKGTLQLIKESDTTNFRLFGDSVTFTYPLHISTESIVTIKGSFNWLAKSGDTYPSGEDNFKVTIKPNKITVAKATEKVDSNLLSIFLLCFGTGLLAIITPCVFPLIPVTVSFFLKRSGSRKAGIKNAVIYSLSIIAIYTIPTILITLIFGDKALYTISTSAFSNLLFFAIFIVFAISFFGAFELTLPNSWANKADEKAGKGGIIGIFFMALTLVIVSFSCTGPLVGTLLGQTSTKGVSIAPIIGMFGFGAGLALPFSLFAFFPSMLQSLPKSGSWLNSVKVAFGFIELALAMKFLSNVDLIYHWHLLDRDVFLVIWIVIFVLMGLYLLG